MVENRFWIDKTLAELSDDEWESLCDGCGRCCQIRLEDSETGQLMETAITCRLFDNDSCRCTQYSRRHVEVKNCVSINADNVSDLYWLPKTCAYKLVDEGQDLHPWHPLVAGNHQAIKEAGISVYGKTISEEHVHQEDIESYIKWV